MRNIVAALVCLFLLGCGTFDLDKKWLPLEQIVERPGGGTYVTTIGSNMYVGNLDRWLETHPVGDVRFFSIVSHEHVHAIRQEELGLFQWLYRYSTERSFRWHEEKLGWYVQLRLKQVWGLSWTVDGVVKSLDGYGLRLADKEELRAWVIGVKNGTWEPLFGELPEQYEWLKQQR